MVFRKHGGGIGMETFYGVLLTEFGKVTRRVCTVPSAAAVALLRKLPVQSEARAELFSWMRGENRARSLVSAAERASRTRSNRANICIFFCHDAGMATSFIHCRETFYITST